MILRLRRLPWSPSGVGCFQNWLSGLRRDARHASRYCAPEDQLPPANLGVASPGPSGQEDYFRILKLYLTYFRGQHSSNLQLMSVAPEPVSKAWDMLTASLGLADATAGQRRNTPAGAPPLAGVVELTGERGHPHQLLLRVDQPTPGIVHLFALPMCGQVFVVIRLYLYGDRAPAAVLRDEPLWHTWMNEHFPAVGHPSNVGSD